MLEGQPDGIAVLKGLKRAKGGQMEIIGLTIIILLVIIGVLFGIQFVLKAKPPTIGREFRESQYAANFLSTLTGTTSACNGLSITQLLQNCVTRTGIDCPSGKGACEEVEALIETILDKTIGKSGQNRAYQLMVKGSNIDITKSNRGGCPGEKEVAEHTLPTRAGVVSIRLELC
ncbi:MAG: hypothetical protein QXU88_00555 [Candidatus Woesearchaeota archaeon]